MDHTLLPVPVKAGGSLAAQVAEVARQRQRRAAAGVEARRISPLVATPLRISKDAPHISELKAALRRRANIEPVGDESPLAPPAAAPAAPTLRAVTPPALQPTADVENAPAGGQRMQKARMRRRNVLGGGGGATQSAAPAPLADRTNQQEAKNKAAVAVRV